MAKKWWYFIYPVLVILQCTILRTSTEYVILFGQETKSLFVVRYCSTSLVGEPEGQGLRFFIYVKSAFSLNWGRCANKFEVTSSSHTKLPPFPSGFSCASCVTKSGSLLVVPNSAWHNKYSIVLLCSFILNWISIFQQLFFVNRDCAFAINVINTISLQEVHIRGVHK